MKTALLFSGQGERGLLSVVQKELKNESPLLKRALRIIDCSIDSLISNGGRALEHSYILQPVLIAISLTQAARLKDQGLEADYYAGHSLGELATWSFAGAISPEQAVELAALRGRGMTRVAQSQKGGMLALTNIDEAGLQKLLAIGKEKGQLSVGAFNSPQEVVLTGSLQALKVVAPLCQSRRLNVEGAWHSPFMEEAKPEFAAALSDIQIGQYIRPVVSGLDGECITDPQEMRPRLLEQLTKPLLWTAVISKMVSLGVEKFVVAGPGRVLRYLIYKNLQGIKASVL